MRKRLRKVICEVPVRYGRDGDSVTVRPAQTVSAVLPAADSDGAPQFEQQVINGRTGTDGGIGRSGCEGG